MATDRNAFQNSTIFARSLRRQSLLIAAGVLTFASLAGAQNTGTPAGRGATPASGGASATPAPPAVAAGVATPAGYVIGPDDALAIVFWREKELSADVVVRPDGMISLPLLNDIKAEGLTPDQLRVALTGAAAKFVEEPTVTVVVKAINSRRVFITGQVGKPGPYPLGGPTTVLQLIATSGGVMEYAKKDKIMVVRKENGKDVVYKFNYDEVLQGKKLQQNIELKPGDTIIVP
jgi:polysaccharide export outer membrane protein